MSFTDQKSFKATAEHLKAAWLGGKNGKYFKCAMCGHKWELGETVRWVYTNDMKGACGNPFVCVDCDGPDVKERWAQMCQEYRDLKKKFWYFYR